MRFLVAAVVAALAFAGAAHASDLQVATLRASDDVSLPFWCDWRYDWDARCYREDGARLAVGGEDDKVWRSALRFPTASLPARAAVVTAELALSFDGTCVAPRRTSRPCDGGSLEFGAHPIFTPRWYAKREVEFGAQIATATLDGFAAPQWVVWDLTDLVADWVSDGSANNGVLLKVVDGQEELESTGPLFPSSSYPVASLRPKLTVWYVTPTP